MQCAGTLCRAVFMIALVSGRGWVNIRVAGVIYFATYAAVAEAVTDPALYYNRASGAGLLEAMRDIAVQQILSSTCAIRGIPKHSPIAEDAAMAPVSPYDRTKLAVERALHWDGRLTVWTAPHSQGIVQ